MGSFVSASIKVPLTLKFWEKEWPEIKKRKEKMMDCFIERQNGRLINKGTKIITIYCKKWIGVLVGLEAKVPPSPQRGILDRNRK